MRTFVQLRRLMDTNRDLARKIEALEKKYDEQHSVRGRRWVDCIGRLVRRLVIGKSRVNSLTSLPSSRNSLLLRPRRENRSAFIRDFAYLGSNQTSNI